jgi:hypothetical protein
MRTLLLISWVLAASGANVPGKYVGARLGKPDLMLLGSDGQGTVFGKPATWHARAGVIRLEGDRRIGWSVINQDSLAVTLPDGALVACRVATRNVRGAPIQDSRGGSGDRQIATAHTCQVRNRPAKLTIGLDGTVQLCAQLTEKFELEPTCYSGRFEVLAGEINAGERSIPFTVEPSGDVILATGITLDVGEALRYRRENVSAAP